MRQTYKRHFIFSVAGLLGIVLFIFATNPTSLSAPLLLLLPILVAVTTFITSYLFIEVFTDLPEYRAKTLSGVIAVAPTLMVMLGSLGQLGFQDILLALLLVVGFGWYVRRIQDNVA